jgi:predicted transcriptional regulator
MSSPLTTVSPELVLLTEAARIVASFVQRNATPTQAVNAMISETYNGLIKTLNESPKIDRSLFLSVGALAIASDSPALTASSARPFVAEAVDAPAKGAVVPFVAIENSIHNDHLVCLECGKPFEALKRHLKSQHALSEVDYKRRFHLPANYPMVCEAYRTQRADLARRSQFGIAHRARPRPNNGAAAHEAR